MPPDRSDDPPMPEPAAAARAGAIELEVRGPSGLLDDPLLLRARGAGPEEALVWRGRYRDDDGRVWRSSARGGDLLAAWTPAKQGTGGLAALQSLQPVRIDVRVEAPDGRAAMRTLTRRLMNEGVRRRRWREGLAASLYLPAEETPRATLLVDATAGPQQPAVAALAAPLLASRGVLVLAVAPGRSGPSSDMLAVARERLAAVPDASDEIHVLPALDPFGPATADLEPGAAVVLPPGVGVREEDDEAAARAVAWDALLASLGARLREPG